jgi:formylmethanofuran dehydrogenase subunit E
MDRAGARVHGGFGSFIPLGIKIGLDAMRRLDTKPRELAVLYYDSDRSPCGRCADGIAIATYASVGQRTLTIASEKMPEGAVAVIVILPRKGGPALPVYDPGRRAGEARPDEQGPRSARTRRRREPAP